MQKSKKTILFMAQLPPPVHGAALRNKSLIESEVVNREFKIVSLPLMFAADLRTIGKFSFKKITLTLTYSWRLFRALISKKIDLAYFTMSSFGGAFYRDILFITLLKLFQKKVLLHFRIKGIRKTADSWLGKTLVRYAFSGSDIVCLSKHHTEDILGFTNKQPYIVPNGIKVEREILDSLDKSSKNSNLITKILFLSNLGKTKGVYELLAAASILRTRNIKFCVDIVGDEWDISFDELRKLIKSNDLETAVNVLGPRYDKEKYIMISEADIFVFPTYFELFPGVILEAMEFGKAIISTFEGSIPDIIDNGHNGILVEPKNSLDLANAMEVLIKDPEKRRVFGIKAKEKFFSEFTLEEFEQNMIRVWHDAINK